MSRCSAGFIAFFLCGRLSVIVAMPSATSTSSVSSFISNGLRVLSLVRLSHICAIFDHRLAWPDCQIRTRWGDRDHMPGRSSWFSESLARGVRIVKAFDRESPKMRISDVALKAGMTRAAARRYLLTLKELGYVASEGDWFFPMPRILELGYSFVSSARLEDFIEPILKKLS